MIGQFVQNSETPIEITKEVVASTEILDEILEVENGLKNGAAKDLVKKFGMACPLPGSFQSSLVSIIDAKSYPDAIRETILCGGDSCTRAHLIGSCLAAKFGIQGIPEEWIVQVDDIEDIIEKALVILASK